MAQVPCHEAIACISHVRYDARSEGEHVKTWDLVLFGATGFTGRYAARYLDAHASSSLKIALAGRNEAKLRAVAQGMNREVGILIADVDTPQSVDAMVAQTPPAE